MLQMPDTLARYRLGTSIRPSNHKPPKAFLTGSALAGFGLALCPAFERGKPPLNVERKRTRHNGRQRQDSNDLPLKHVTAQAKRQSNAVQYKIRQRSILLLQEGLVIKGKRHDAISEQTRS
jgi:hypothetical protein